MELVTKKQNMETDKEENKRMNDDNESHKKQLNELKMESKSEERSGESDEGNKFIEC